MIPVATHRVAVLRTVEDVTARDSYDDPPVWETVATEVRAVIGSYRGNERTDRAQAETLTALLTMDPVPCGLTHLDRVVDAYGRTWQVSWATWRPGLGVDHWTAGLVAVEGQEP